ncbi:MAG: fasciclin domain-containing protein [Actinomycetota bacterium]|nr:fasciclin domain-containing protein [Actinomycetota bacterium]
MLTDHVIPQRYDAQSLFYAASVASVQGDRIEITGTPDAPLVNGNQVLCSNIPTANATMFVIDSVLTPPAA